MNTEFELRGYYKTNFFTVYLDGEFNMEFEKMTQQNLGTLVHEYTHYLQNISTIYGLRNSLFFFTYMYEVKKHIVENRSLKLPLKNIKFSQSILEGNKVFSYYHGTMGEDTPFHKTIKHRLVIEEANNGEEKKSIYLDFYYKDVRLTSKKIGNLAVKEGMARLMQQFYDPDVKHPTYPYCSVESLCNLTNPKLLDDKRSLIALCILALNSQNSGITLFELILTTLDEKDLDGRVLYKKFIHQDERWIINAGIKKKIADFLLESLDLFEDRLDKSLYADLEHFPQLARNLRMAITENVNPILEILYNDEFDKFDKLKAIIEFYGFPHLRTKDGNSYWPLNKAKNGPASEYLELMGQMIVFERIMGQSNGVCGMYQQCQLASDNPTDKHCLGTQWKRDQICTFKIISDNWGLNQKIKD